ncbi:hypothetical protein ACMTF7_001738 [Campylobacter jejuni]
MKIDEIIKEQEAQISKIIEDYAYNNKNVDSKNGNNLFDELVDAYQDGSYTDMDDRISEIADSNVSIYFQDYIKWFEKNYEDIEEEDFCMLKDDEKNGVDFVSKVIPHAIYRANINFLYSMQDEAKKKAAILILKECEFPSVSNEKLEELFNSLKNTEDVRIEVEAFIDDLKEEAQEESKKKIKEK